MFLVITQVIALLAATSGFNESPVLESVNNTVITPEDVKAANDDLKRGSIKRIEVINLTNETDFPREHEIESDASNNTEAESIATPVVISPVIEEKEKEIVVLETMPTESHEVVGAETTLDIETPLSDNSENVAVEETAAKIESKTVLIEKSFNYIKYDDISDNAVYQEDIKVVNDDLKVSMKSLDETAPEEVAEVDNIDKQTTVKPEKTVVETKGHELQEIQLAVIAPIVIADDSNENKNTVVDKLPNYVKHGSKGESLADDIEQWTCVRDTETGLMWEVKSEKDNLRNSNNLYSWYDPERKTLPGKSNGGRCEGDSDCDTRAYVKAMNDRKYCGYNDWHLPTREEMQTLVNLESAKGKATINKKYFPHAVPSWYWTSSDEDNKDDFAWYVLFRNGFSLSDLKERPKHIRLVRNYL